MHTHLFRVTLILLAFAGAAFPADPRPRARDIGLAPGIFEPGPLNAITDVAGVLVGHVTRIEGESIRTGVTAILPHQGNLFQHKTPAAVFVGNAFGKLAGSTQVEELGTLETPIILTNTLAVGTAIDAVVKWSLVQPGNKTVRSVNALVGETNDGGLNDIRSQPITTDDVIRAINSATPGPVAEGNVGAGTGCEAFGFKAGIGTSSRILPQRFGGYCVGVLVQANFGGVLMMDGLPVGKTLGRHAFQEPRNPADRKPGDGSCMIVVATDAPVDAKALKRIAARSIFALARTGSLSSPTAAATSPSPSPTTPISARPTPPTARNRAPLFPTTTSPHSSKPPWKPPKKPSATPSSRLPPKPATTAEPPQPSPSNPSNNS